MYIWYLYITYAIYSTVIPFDNAFLNFKKKSQESTLLPMASGDFVQAEAVTIVGPGAGIHSNQKAGPQKCIQFF